MTARKRKTRIAEQDRPKRIRAVYYVRQSTEGQDDLLSPEAQIRIIKDFAETESADVIGGYEDIAISGYHAENRPGFLRMIADAISSEHPLDMIIVYDLSRFSRNTLDLLQHVKLLREHGVRLQSVTEPHNGDPASDESWTHTSAGNEALIPKTAIKTRDGQAEALLRGYHPGGPTSFGFKTEDVVVKTKRNTPGGRQRDRETFHSRLVPDWGGEADWVVKMYDMSNEGHSTAAIAHYLREQGVRTRDGNDFLPGAVNYILRNPRNAGNQERGRESVSEHLYQHKITKKEQAHEPIVSLEVWNKTKEMLQSRSPNRKSGESESDESNHGSPRSNSSPSRFSGLTECGNCGNSVVLGYQGEILCSRKKIRVAYCPNSHREKLAAVQGPAIRILIGDLMDEEFLNEHFDHVVELNKVLLNEHEQQESVIDQKIKVAKGKIKNLTDTTENTEHKDRNMTEIFDRLDERREELRKLEEDKRQLAAESEGLVAFVNDRDRIIKNAMDLRTIIETAEPQIANQFIKLFVKKLVIKDHTGTIHFKVPSLGEGPYRPQESFRIGEYPDPSPDPFESEKYPFERSMGMHAGCAASTWMPPRVGALGAFCARVDCCTSRPARAWSVALFPEIQGKLHVVQPRPEIDSSVTNFRNQSVGRQPFGFTGSAEVG